MLKSAVIGLLLFSVVASSIAESRTALLFTLLAAWLLFPVLVGIGGTLDAGRDFMLITLGIVVVVSLGQNGLSALFQ